MKAMKLLTINLCKINHKVKAIKVTYLVSQMLISQTQQNKRVEHKTATLARSTNKASDKIRFQ